MARLTRQIGLNAAQVRIPSPASVGPAIIKTAATMADQAFSLQSDKLTQEARVAAASLNFERDSEGNLSAPALPIGDNGLLTPSVYDRAYTEMVTQRYLQQTQIDTSERLNMIAADHILDPEGYRVAAESYVQKVTELAPDIIKGDVNITAQKKMVEHFNLITRETSEKEWENSRDAQLLTIDNIEKELLSYATANDDVAVAAKFLEHQANLLQGIDPNFWGTAFAEARTQALNDQLVSAYITGEVQRIPDDEEGLGYAMAEGALVDFLDGKGKVKIIRDGEIVAVDVLEAVPDNETRAIIATNAAKSIEWRKGAHANIRDARHLRQYNIFEDELLKRAVAAESESRNVDIPWLVTEWQKAFETDNDHLERKIRAEIKLAAQSIPSGPNLTALERRFASQSARFEVQAEAARAEYAKSRHVENFEMLPTEEKEEFELALPARLGVFNLPQTNESAEKADQWLLSYGPQISWVHEELGGTPFSHLEKFIQTGMRQLGVIPLSAIDYFGNQIGNIKTANGAELMRMLSIYKTMRQTDNVRGKLKTALGDANFAALNFIQDNMLPSQHQDSELLAGVFERAQKGELFDAWKNVDPEDRQVLEERLESELTTFNSRFMAPDHAALPYELREKAKNMMAGQVHTLGSNPSEDALHAISDGIVDELLTSPDSPYRLSEYGLNMDKARGYGMFGLDLFMGTSLADFMNTQPHNGVAVHPPEFFYEADEVEYGVGPGFQKFLKRLQAEERLSAGKNAFLVYNAMQTAITGTISYEVHASTKGSDPIQLTTNDLFFGGGEPIYYYPQPDVDQYHIDVKEKFEREQWPIIRDQEARENMPIVPNDRGF
jgi:molybdopterin-binding protein